MTKPGGAVVNLAYDPLGRLWQVSSSSGTTQFLYDGDHEALEYDANGATLWRYFFGPGADEPIIADQGGSLSCSNTRFLHVDHQGSMIATDDCSGNRATVATYDEYGIPGASNWGRFQYTGQAYIPEIGMYYYKSRIYSPTLGRFMQTDPVGYEDQTNLYEYVGDDPVDRVDPQGEAQLEITVAGGILGSKIEVTVNVDTTNREVTVGGNLRAGVGSAASFDASGKFTKSGAPLGNRWSRSYEGNVKAEASIQLLHYKVSGSASRSFVGASTSSSEGKSKIPAGQFRTERSAGFVPDVGVKGSIDVSAGFDLKGAATLSLKSVDDALKSSLNKLIGNK